MTAMLDIDQLRTFIAISETGSFTKAAEVVNKTQSAVSMQMKRLEERLERPIFSRDGRASKLTEDGQRLLDYARRIVKLNVETLATSIYQYASRGSFEEGALAALLIVAASIGPVAWLTRFSDIHCRD